jgi:CheY-like chemotaxis protein
VVFVTKDFVILIADDDCDDQSFIKDALKKRSFGGSIDCVADGNKLIEYLKAKPIQPGLILLDLNMPFKSGYEVLAEIKQDPEFRGIPTVVFTSSTRAEDERRCYALGADNFIRKPLSMGEYEDVAGQLLHFISAGKG